MAGLLFIDFEKGDVFQISGRAEVIFDDPQIQAFQGAELLWRMHEGRVVRRPHLPVRFLLDGQGAHAIRTHSTVQCIVRQFLPD